MARPTTPAHRHDAERDERSGSMEGIGKSLDAIDAAILKSRGGGPPGSGLHTLLDDLAASMLGVPRTAFPSGEPGTTGEPPPTRGDDKGEL